RVWTETEVIDGKDHKALTVILRTRGCTWAIRGGCSFCGYVNDSFVKKITGEHLIQQFGKALERFDDHTVIKLYTSGSFLDPTEVPTEAQETILDMVPDGVVRFQSEAQAHHVTDERLENLRTRLPDGCQFALGIGMEASSQEVLEYSVNNEFTLEDFENACHVAEKHDTLLKCYVMVKPPFLTEQEAIDEAVLTAQRVSELPALEAVSFNPTSIHKNTLVERLFHRGEYSPPWLWSVVEVLKQADAHLSCHFKSDVVAGGQRRGAHNCGQCDEDVLRAIEAHKLTGDITVFDRVDCDCKQVWEDQLDLEELGLAGGALAKDFRVAAGEAGGHRDAMADWYAEPQAS
ncbi:MAG: archaeosine biosynthesis radical SAM protein RaSEA, partial [Candidatus Thermoplasmatota archaeon]|nr:archaeosine biosynthesis radical SAM protein RaSEA [Candidatus Thermoplasmatota archaeon]